MYHPSHNVPLLLLCMETAALVTFVSSRGVLCRSGLVDQNGETFSCGMQRGPVEKWLGALGLQMLALCCELS